MAKGIWKWDFPVDNDLFIFLHKQTLPEPKFVHLALQKGKSPPTCYSNTISKVMCLQPTCTPPLLAYGLMESKLGVGMSPHRIGRNTQKISMWKLEKISMLSHPMEPAFVESISKLKCQLLEVDAHTLHVTNADFPSMNIC